MKELSPDELVEFKKTPVRKKSTGGRTRTKAENVRDYETWFKKMPQHGGHCNNPHCKDPREPSKYPTQMVAEISTGEEICRYCFLDGYGL
jgi:hypothetical protein